MKNKRVFVSQQGVAAVTTNLPKTPKLGRLGITDKTPRWGLSLVDIDGEWGWQNVTRSDLAGVVALLREMEKLTWSKIRTQMTGGKRRRGALHKYIPMSSCSPSAQARLAQLGLEEHDGFCFRFRHGNLGRLWGVVEGTTFYPVWWDPAHTVCKRDDHL